MTIFSAFMAFGAKEKGQFILYDIGQLLSADSFSKVLLDIEVFILIFVLIFASVAELTFAILLGNRMAKKHKLGGTIGAIVLLDYVKQAIFLIVYVSVLIVLMDAEWEFSMHLFVLIVMALYAAIGWLCYYLSGRFMRRMNVS